MSAEDMALNGSVLRTMPAGGAGGSRTPDLLNAIEALSRLSHSPTRVTNIPEALRGRNRGPLQAPQPTRLAAMYAPTPIASSVNRSGTRNLSTTGSNVLTARTLATA